MDIARKILKEKRQILRNLPGYISSEVDIAGHINVYSSVDLPITELFSVIDGKIYVSQVVCIKLSDQAE